MYSSYFSWLNATYSLRLEPWPPGLSQCLLVVAPEVGGKGLGPPYRMKNHGLTLQNSDKTWGCAALEWWLIRTRDIYRPMIWDFSVDTGLNLCQKGESMLVRCSNWNSVHGNWGFGFCNWGLGFSSRPHLCLLCQAQRVTESFCIFGKLTFSWHPAGQRTLGLGVVVMYAWQLNTQHLQQYYFYDAILLCVQHA